MEKLNGGRTKIVWTVSSNTFDTSPTELADRFVRLGINGLLTVFAADRIESYKALRQKLAERSSSDAIVDPALIFSLVGRRAFFFTESASRDIPVDSLLDIHFVCDRAACLRRSDPGKGEGVRVAFTSADMLDRLTVGSTISFGYGEVEFTVESVSKKDATSHIVKVRTAAGGSLRSGMDVTSKHLRSGIFPLMQEDLDALRGDLFEVADVIVAQGVSSLNDLRELREVLGERLRSQGAATEKVPPLMFLRIDSALSLSLLDSAFESIDGVFLNRSELGMSVHLHDLPFVQKDVIAKCNRAGKTVLVASDLFSSMRKNSSPTRAEVSDLCNVVLDGVDALVLGREVTEAPQADEAARYCHETIGSAEASFPVTWASLEHSIESDLDAIAIGAMDAVRNSGAKAVVCLTRRGFTAGRLSSLHPPVDIIALAYNERVKRQLGLMRGVRSMCIEENFALDDLFCATRHKLSSAYGFSAGDRVVFVSLSASSIAKRGSHMFLIEEFS